MSLLKRLLFIPPVLAGVGLVAFAISTRQPPATIAIEETATPVRVIEARPQSFTPRVSGFGEVQPARTWRAVAQVEGRVVFVHREFVRGGTLGKDEVIIEIADDEYKLAVAQVQAEIASIEADIERTREESKTISQSLAIEADALKVAQREFERQQSLVERNVAAATLSEQAERNMLSQRVKVQALQNQLTLLPTTLASLEQSKAVAEARLEVARLDLERTSIRAPFRARVAETDIEISQYVGSGTQMGVLDGIDAAEIDVQIPPRQMAGFIRLAFEGLDLAALSANVTGDRAGQMPEAAGLSAHVSVGFPENAAGWDASVTRISDVVDPQTRSIGVIVRVENPYDHVRPGRRPPLIKGMFTNVELRGRPIDDVFILPRAAIREGRIMIVDDDSRLGFMPVAIAYSYKDIAVVDTPLPPGTMVIVSDLAPAIPGMLLDPKMDEQTGQRIAALATPPAREP